MQQHAGVFRTQASMDEGVVKVKAIAEARQGHPLDKSKVFNTARIEALEVENLIEAALATMISAAAAGRAAARTPSTTTATRPSIRTAATTPSG